MSSCIEALERFLDPTQRAVTRRQQHKNLVGAEKEAWRKELTAIAADIVPKFEAKLKELEDRHGIKFKRAPQMLVNGVTDRMKELKKKDAQIAQHLKPEGAAAAEKAGVGNEEEGEEDEAMANERQKEKELAHGAVKGAWNAVLNWGSGRK